MSPDRPCGSGKRKGPDLATLVASWLAEPTVNWPARLSPLPDLAVPPELATRPTMANSRPATSTPATAVKTRVRVRDVEGSGVSGGATPLVCGAVDLLEHAGKRVLAAHGVPVPIGHLAVDVEQAVAAGDAIGYPVAVKAQVPVGGRGKAGGIKVAADAEELAAATAAILGMSIKGHVVRRVWVEEALAAARELYLSFTFDRSAKRHLGMLSGRGGVDIEEVAAKYPEAIHRFHVVPLNGLS